MPIYEYECESCDEIFEELILGKHDRPDGCPACGGSQVHRVISQTSFQLKGGGWYVTDFKDSPPTAPKESAAKEPPSDGGTTGGASASSEGSTASGADATSSSSKPKADPGAA